MIAARVALNGLTNGRTANCGLLPKLTCFLKRSSCNIRKYSVNSSTQQDVMIDRVVDIVLYKNQSRPKFVLLISAAAGVQLLFWGYLSYSALEDYYTATVTKNKSLESEKAADRGYLEERVQALQSKSSLKWRVAFSLLALSVGAFFALTALMYPRRMVNSLVFNRQSNTLTISTQTPLGGIHQSKVSVVDVQPTVANSKASHYALKVKRHRLFYLLDKNGEFPNLKLFDTLIGIRNH